MDQKLAIALTGAGLLGAFFTRYLTPTPVSAQATPTQEIRAQIAKYTAALDAADIDLASQVWQISPDVSFIHPAGHAHGWEEVKGIYKFFGATLSERKLTV